ncbi:MAG: DUF952 domain-containing protein [Cyanobacteria bacterium J06632_22]
MNTLFHLLPTTAISLAQDQGWYEPPTFAEEGFIHCSFLHQVIPTANRHYSGESNLSLLEIDPRALTDVRVENLYGGSDNFPHIYSRLPWSAVRRIHAIKPDSTGNWMSRNSALTLFDALDSVETDTLIGQWQGYGFPTGHPMDGLLEATGWYGKEFITTEQVHPLLFSDSQGSLYKISPHPWMMTMARQFSIPKIGAIQPLFELFNRPFRTEQSQAHLRMTRCRGKVSATMIYDYLPIHDSFRQVDTKTLLGLMDDKGSPEQFFFVLTRH